MEAGSQRGVCDSLSVAVRLRGFSVFSASAPSAALPVSGTVSSVREVGVVDDDNFFLK